MPAWLPFAGRLELRRAVSSDPYNPAAAGARRRTHRVAWRVRPPPAKVTLAASFAATGCYGTDPTGAAVARLAREWVVRFCGSRSAAPPRLTELNRTGSPPSRTLAERSQRPQRRLLLEPQPWGSQTLADTSRRRLVFGLVEAVKPTESARLHS